MNELIRAQITVCDEDLKNSHKKTIKNKNK